MLLLIKILGRGVRIVIAELDGDMILAEAFAEILQLFGRIIHIQHAVDARGGGDTRNDLIRRLLDILVQMAGNVDAGDLILVPLGKGDHLIRAAARLHGKRRVDINFVRCRDRVQHTLQILQIGKRFSAGENKIAIRRDFVHRLDALEDRLHGKARAVSVLLLVHAKRTVIAAVIRHKYRNGRAAFARLIGMAHSSFSRPLSKVKRYFTLFYIILQEQSIKFLIFVGAGPAHRQMQLLPPAP